jgi:hypothetical protein
VDGGTGEKCPNHVAEGEPLGLRTHEPAMPHFGEPALEEMWNTRFVRTCDK